MAPSRKEIEQLCSHLATSDPSPFFDRVSPNVEWDVLGGSADLLDRSNQKIRLRKLADDEANRNTSCGRALHRSRYV